MSNQMKGNFPKPECQTKCFEERFEYSGSKEDMCQCGNSFTGLRQKGVMDCSIKDFTVSSVSFRQNKSEIYQYCKNDRTESSKAYCDTNVCIPGSAGPFCIKATTIQIKTISVVPTTPAANQNVQVYTYQSTNETYVGTLPCRDNNGGCGDKICWEVNDEEIDNGKVQVECKPPDEEIFDVPEGCMIFFSCICLKINLLIFIGTHVQVKKPKGNWNYKGCFQKVHSAKELMINSVKSCSEYCSQTLFYGMQWLYSTLLNLEQTVMCMCQKCSKREISNVSLNIGCFKFLELEHKESESLSKLLCVNRCRELDFPYSGTMSPDLNVRGKSTKYNYCINDKNENRKAYCRSGVCLPGWVGAFCDRRDCATQNGGCNTTMNCVQEIVNGLMQERCICESRDAAVDENECIVLKVSDGENKSILLIYISIIVFAVLSLLPVAILFKHLKKRKGNGMKYFEIH
ncbi:hypothetical protein HELRODRAFT_177747 [Helobdella robusta]|uniref:Uncharacterized protein n=1 Tax=Helobdella robusta TaxID=6412 RepID=T1FC66_HELRO|nr:hypothetical protein HELRODRAFT_177747 [Helobdella robusta]ESN97692.1 hypothetical protein HELRODRAFT_177747 [Helobdella robusta]